jgi:DNA-binding response OmpR family regulator
MKKILVVEDDQNIAKALAVRLGSAGYEVTVAPSALTGMAAALKTQPDLAVLDIYMKTPFIVEDDRDNVEAMAVRLKSAGYEAIVAPATMTGAAAASIQPDLARLEISVPAGNGFSVAEKIQRLVTAATPIIFLTAGRQPGLQQKAQNLGAVGFFEKPYDADELLAAIERALSENESTHQ